MPLRFLCSFFLERSFGAAADGCTQTSDSALALVLTSVFYWALDCVLAGSAAATVSGLAVGFACAGAGVDVLAA